MLEVFNNVGKSIAKTVKASDPLTLIGVAAGAVIIIGGIAIFSGAVEDDSVTIATETDDDGEAVAVEVETVDTEATTE